MAAYIERVMASSADDTRHANAWLSLVHTQRLRGILAKLRDSENLVQNIFSLHKRMASPVNPLTNKWVVAMSRLLNRRVDCRCCFKASKWSTPWHCKLYSGAVEIPFYIFTFFLTTLIYCPLLTLYNELLSTSSLERVWTIMLKTCKTEGEKECVVQ